MNQPTPQPAARPAAARRRPAHGRLVIAGLLLMVCAGVVRGQDATAAPPHADANAASSAQAPAHAPNAPAGDSPPDANAAADANRTADGNDGLAAADVTRWVRHVVRQAWEIWLQGGWAMPAIAANALLMFGLGMHVYLALRRK
ncbi:MAG: hypothetical protein GVY24_04440, partial [Planctomycetes bacterium]|nr:hypothetical protein [Planctomycetota bacterium]